MRNFAPACVAIGNSNCTFSSKMFVDEFLFSFSLLVFTLGLSILGTVILLDAFRRFVLEWYSKSSSNKNGRVVLVVDIRRPVAKRVRNGTQDLIQRPLSMTEKKVS